MTKTRRRQAGEGGISAYQTKGGTRYLAKYRYTTEDGARTTKLKRGFVTRKAAAEFLRTKLSEVDQGRHVSTTRMTVGEHLDAWLDGLQRAPSTVASYRKNVRLHLRPTLGAVRLQDLTGTRITSVYRELEASGRVDGNGGLAPRTVLYIHTILHAALKAAVRDGLIATNPADRAQPPSAKDARAPEMLFWTHEELAAFLRHAQERQDDLLIAWQLLAMTGMRRGEALALQWRDIDFDTSRVAVRRSATLVKTKGAGETVVVGIPKSGRPRTVDLDPTTLTALRSHRAALASISLDLVRDGSPVLGDLKGEIRHPERFSRRWKSAVRVTARAIPELPQIRLHDLRHTHATILMKQGVPAKVVTERLGHANVTITLGTYSHVTPGMQAAAANALAGLVYGTGS